MRRCGFSVLVMGVALALVACGNDTADGTTGAGGSGSGGGGTGGSTGTGSWPTGEWVRLVDAGWTLGSGTEGYHCALKTIDEDLWIGGFRAVAPEGTHHTVVTVSDSSQPDGDFPCDAGRLSDEMIFSSGVGTDDVMLPEGVAFKISKGKRVLLNLHLYNVTGAELTETSGTEVMLVSAAEVEQEAEMIFAGTPIISLAPQSPGATSGTCTFAQDATVMSIWPHMHQYGTHMTVTHESDDGDEVLHDAPFAFEEQVNYRITPRVVKAGERLRVTCDYENTSSDTVTFGDSSDQEMCFAGVYRYPAEKSGLFCDFPF